jgi:hypothetical protein
LLYIVIAFLVIGAGQAEGPSGALRYLAEGGGRLLLFVMAAGLIAYSLWRLADAAFDIERHGSEGKGLAVRAGAAASGIAHLFLAWQAIRLIQGTSSGGGDGTQEGAQTALGLPFGGTLLALAGAVLIGVGLYQFVRAAKASFLRHLEPRVANTAWALWSGRAGYAARGLVFLITGYFLVRAGLSEQASAAGGTGEALAWLSSPTDIIVAIGLFAFGVFSLIEARFRVLQDVPVRGAVSRATGGRL